MTTSFLVLPLLLLPVALVCLRAAVALANRFLGPGPETADLPAVDFESSDAQTPDPDNPYSAPGQLSVAAERTSKAIPEPSVGRSLIAVFVQWLGSMLTMFVMLLLAQFVSLGVLAGGVLVFVYPVAIAVVNTVILTLVLPTTLRRGLLVAVLQLVMVGLIIAGIMMAITLFVK